MLGVIGNSIKWRKPVLSKGKSDYLPVVGFLSVQPVTFGATSSRTWSCLPAYATVSKLRKGSLALLRWRTLGWSEQSSDLLSVLLAPGQNDWTKTDQQRSLTHFVSERFYPYFRPKQNLETLYQSLMDSCYTHLAEDSNLGFQNFHFSEGLKIFF